MARDFENLRLADYELPAALAERTLSPALIVYLDRVRENIRRVIAYAGEPRRWRPHLKTTKMPEVWAELLSAGVREFKCATTREARLLLELLDAQGIRDADVLLAYPLLGPGLTALGRLAAAHPATRVSTLCEAPELVREIPSGVSIFIDVNPGMHRTGVPMDDGATIQEIANQAGERFRGLHFYDGHLHAGGVDARRSAAFACYDRLMDLCHALASQGTAAREIITSGTPTFLHALAYEPFSRLTADPDGPRHRISPGTVVFHDQRSEEDNPNLDLLPAACVLVRVVSHPTPGVVTCDGGSKSVAAESGDPCVHVIGAEQLVALTPNEEHLPLRVTEGPPPARGTRLYLIPRHICPTVNLAEEALLVDGSSIRVIPVRGRGHDLA